LAVVDRRPPVQGSIEVESGEVTGGNPGLANPLKDPFFSATGVPPSRLGRGTLWAKTSPLASWPRSAYSTVLG
jgi:hypothetical protein